MLSQKAVGRSALVTFGMIPFLMALGMGISVINGVAVLEGLFGKRNTEFVRTPKYGAQAAGSEWKKKAGTFKNKLSVLPFIEILFGIYLAACTIEAVLTHTASGTIPFLVIFSFGYLYVGVLTLHSRWLSARARAEAQRPAQADTKAMAA
jgi:hypothetical protein